MVHFTPVSAAVGGLLIGLSAALLWVAKGRIAGISGILGGLGALRSGDVAWRAIFLVGLMAAPLLYGAAGGALPEPASPTNPALLVVAGLLVGFGTRLGNGCTSGHGVCGLARLSPRSLTATGLFMASAAATVFVTRHLIGA
ncbi:YeeE/YedE family protein [Roseomonas genomospecies 6]|uniref:YeeE/YedE family protein n=2 Tax=Roseomonas genomospecies 6 TaxID=214106 RepID=A0A9W7NIC9_9PROT|nr:YeeE/YedE thiosulfate transporter family protein [Roseomonas genomospecies 6]KAA0679507.1 YeeE/YedE family protein [Roseomonas genomospecies 6]